MTDVTARWACFGLWGPRAREILAPLTPDGLDFGYMRLREITVGDVPVRALRVTFVGEFGWELYCPTEYGAGLWATLFEAGQPHGLLAGGYRAIDSLRLEKGYRAVGRRHHPGRERHSGQGLEFCVGTRQDSSSDIRRRYRSRPQRRLRAITLEDPRAIAPRQRAGARRRWGWRRRRDRRAGHERRATATPSERSIAYAYLPASFADGEARRDRHLRRMDRRARSTAEPLFDPEGARIRGWVHSRTVGGPPGGGGGARSRHT